MEIKIKDLVWKIYYEDPGECFSCGFTDRFYCEIHLNSKLTDEQLKRTIKHEVTHAIIWSYGLVNFAYKKFMEEDVCNFVETYLDEIKELSEEVYNKIKNTNKNRKGKLLNE